MRSFVVLLVTLLAVPSASAVGTCVLVACADLSPAVDPSRVHITESHSSPVSSNFFSLFVVPGSHAVLYTTGFGAVVGFQVIADHNFGPGGGAVVCTSRTGCLGSALP